MTPLRTAIVCVDYADLLSITLPYNRKHFSEVVVITSETDEKTVEVAVNNRAKVFRTDAFYRNGAVFNKFLALEEGLDYFGRHGWMCIMDADVLWPKLIPWIFIDPDDDEDDELYDDYTKGHRRNYICPDYLYTPLRHMMLDITAQIPQEPYWLSFPLHPQQVEWAGYTQIFHASDYHLPVSNRWHETNWTHAGGPDSFFQQLWSPEFKHRPPFECLHLGPAGTNWCGRVTPLTDGSVPEAAGERYDTLTRLMRKRRTTRSFDSEKL